MATRSGVDQLVIPRPPLVGQFGAYHGIAKIKKYEICGWSPISGKGSPIVIPVSFPVHRWWSVLSLHLVTGQYLASSQQGAMGMAESQFQVVTRWERMLTKSIKYQPEKHFAGIDILYISVSHSCLHVSGLWFVSLVVSLLFFLLSPYILP